MTSKRPHYKGFTISYDPPPIPIRSCDWQFSADGFDGAPDSGDKRCGSAGSIKEAMEQIDSLLET
jgi:hypothetical protein